MSLFFPFLFLPSLFVFLLPREYHTYITKRRSCLAAGRGRERALPCKSITNTAIPKQSEVVVVVRRTESHSANLIFRPLLFCLACEQSKQRERKGKEKRGDFCRKERRNACGEGGGLSSFLLLLLFFPFFSSLQGKLAYTLLGKQTGGGEEGRTNFRPLHFTSQIEGNREGGEEGRKRQLTILKQNVAILGRILSRNGTV